ncbi:adenylate cyclase [Lactobacillus nasalidis]|uniref:Adenylate cyclase n=1 Tax=Lactobacillus nasalidis TaxID=2797258 RepID=A0ABQ3W534_9LACO|nr:CYTH domain-containing protein [Lactobacillus nasalidis]GHV98432.1 adenylate cyclase [Lactobacillus nasalidis]GHV99870.1 adenylate cyclase [Lactobacillus nasalidis]GHW01556.1 adenylate cyclase [Lactobacillus nasalidis]
MSKNREIEAKVALDQKSYAAIIAAYPVKSDFKQSNHYFDLPDWQLKADHSALRIRCFSDRAEETIKVPIQKLQQTYHESLEINDDLTLAQAEQLLKDGRPDLDGSVGKYLKEHYPDRTDQLRLFSWSKTHRTLLAGPNGCELTLDHTSYPDGYQDWEMEIENDSPAAIKEALAEIKRRFSLEVKSANNQSKIARASQHASVK